MATTERTRGIFGEEKGLGSGAWGRADAGLAGRSAGSDSRLGQTQSDVDLGADRSEGQARKRGSAVAQVGKTIFQDQTGDERFLVP